MQKHIFRNSDIRGIVGVDFTMHDVQHLAKAIVIWFQRKNPNLKRIVVGLDGRTHGPEIYKKISQVITQAGYQVYFVGACPTPVFMYGLYQLPVHAGIMITASGSSQEYNGFKLYNSKALVSGQGLQEIYELFEQSKNLASDEVATVGVGKIIPCPIMEQYIDNLWQEFAYLSQYDFSAVLDCSNGTVGPVMKKIIKKMGWKKVVTIGDEIDGTFPMHDPEPSEPKNLISLQQELLHDPQAFGIAFDGDGDRMVGLQRDGNLVLGDRLLPIFAQDIVGRNIGKVVMHDMAQSPILQQNLTQIVTGNLCTATDHLQENVAQDQVVLAGQLHGRYFFKDRHSGYPDALYALLRLLDILVRKRTSLDGLLQILPAALTFAASVMPASCVSCVQEHR